MLFARPRGRLAVGLLLALSVMLSSLLSACDLTGGGGSTTPGTTDKPDNALVVDFAYSSEKKPFLDPLVARFNAARHTLPNDKRPIWINAYVADSGTARTQIANAVRGRDASNQLRPTVWSPSSSEWKPVLNSDADSAIAVESDPIFLTPVTIAMWKPMAEALGWPNTPIGLSDIIALNNDPSGWGSKGHPEWGEFKYAHTNPEVSSTGLSMVAMEFYAAAGKVRDLTLDDINKPEAAAYVKNIEDSIVHYSATTTIFKDNVRRGGMQYISAVALEEVTVIELNKTNMPVPLVAIYPKEGTFWHDNPYIILHADWVTADQRSAAEQFKDFLLEADNQKAALSLGFRPANPDVAIGDPLSATYGVDPSQPKTVLEVPQPEVIVAVKDLWNQYRKATNVVLALDTSPSMDDQDKLSNALAGIKIFLEEFRDVDQVGFLTFDGSVHELVPIGPFNETRAKIEQYIDNPDTLPRGSATAIYDGAAQAVDWLDALKDTGRINAVVLLSDGQDNRSSSQNKAGLIPQLRESANDLSSIKVFPIAYGHDSGVDTDALQEFADATRTSLVTGDTSDIRKVFQSISLYF